MSFNSSTNYFLRKDEEFTSFWSSYLNSGGKNVLFILGLGFDPRATKCLKLISALNTQSTISCMVLKYVTNSTAPQNLLDSLNINTIKLQSIIPENKWITKSIKIMNDSNEYVMSVETSKQIQKNDFKNYSDIIIDISSMPNGVYFPIIKKLLDWINNNLLGRKINLHVVVSENAQFDGKIKARGIGDKVTFMHMFGGTLLIEAKKNLRKVWLPLLGENQNDQLNKINEELSPTEIFPIFPLPSVDPYRTKHLLLEYRELLFDILGIDTRNFLFASEYNPFEVFRKIYETAHHYYDVFEPLGGCNIVISPSGNKLQCVGALLAAYELLKEDRNIGIAHVENQSYFINDSVDLNNEADLSIPYTMWIAGECYD